MSGVYVLKDTETNLLKIGRATNLKERLSNLRTANPRLELVQWFETNDDSTVEAYVHSKLVKHRKSGEFFDVNTVTAISEIKSILNLLTKKPTNEEVDTVRSISDLAEARLPTSEEENMFNELVQIRAQIKTLMCLDEVFTEILMVRIGACNGVAGWASFSGINIDRFDTSKFRRENPELAQKYIERTYSRVLRVRPHMNRN
jgi:excinuclease UvrABC nuclease subunit